MNVKEELELKILIVGKTSDLGGTARYTKKLIRNLENDQDLDFDFIDLKVFYDLPGKYLKRLNLIRNFHKQIDFSKYDLVHFLQLDYSIYGTLRHLKGRIKKPAIIKTSHGMAKREEAYRGIIGRLLLKPVTSYMQKYVQKNVDAVIYVSDDQKEDFIKEYELDITKTFVVYLSSSFETYNGDLKNLLDSKEKVVLFVGRVERRKRLELICELGKLMPDWRFKVVGHVDDQKYYNQIQKLKTENMEFLVDISDNELVNAYQKAKYFVSFSKWENCPVSYLESISQGTPVIAFSMPIHKLIENGCGYHVQNPKDAANKINDLEKNYASIVKNALDTSQMFSWDKTGTETIQIYKNVINSRINMRHLNACPSMR